MLRYHWMAGSYPVVPESGAPIGIAARIFPLVEIWRFYRHLAERITCIFWTNAIFLPSLPMLRRELQVQQVTLSIESLSWCGWVQGLVWSTSKILD